MKVDNISFHLYVISLYYLQHAHYPGKVGVVARIKALATRHLDVESAKASGRTLHTSHTAVRANHTSRGGSATSGQQLHLAESARGGIHSISRVDHYSLSHVTQGVSSQQLGVHEGGRETIRAHTHIAIGSKVRCGHRSKCTIGNFWWIKW